MSNENEIRVRLTRLEGGTALRTDIVEGYMHKPLEVGKSFEMLAPALNPEMTFRSVITSPVVSFAQEDDGSFLFNTASGSLYRLELLDSGQA